MSSPDEPTISLQTDAVAGQSPTSILCRSSRHGTPFLPSPAKAATMRWPSPDDSSGSRTPVAGA
jgi:hypothetical protein